MSNESQRLLVSLVVPFFNEGEGVALFHESLTPVLASLSEYDFEIICVDDGSSDDTQERLLALGRMDPRYTIIEFSRNFGKEAALTAGLEHAAGDAVIPLDADLQDPPELIPVMIEAWRNGAEVVLARRVDRSSDTFMKRKTASLFYRVHNRLSDVQLPENVGDFRLMDRVAVAALRQLPERQRFMKGIFAWIGFRPVYVDYVRPQRTTGHTKFPGVRLWNFALEGITGFSTVPLRIWSYIGAAGALLSFSYGAFIVLRTLLQGSDVPGYASLLTAILFIGSMQMISIGIMGEYVGRTYMEAKQRPQYIIRKITDGRNTK